MLSKLFEYVMLELFGNSLQSDSLQYGFKKGSGCVDAVFTFRESVRYFTSRGSKVFCVSLDANKAFDRALKPRHYGAIEVSLLLLLLLYRCTS